MNNCPKIFVSSTIHDFSDLRSALKYWLEEMGFEVYMSEYNDFKKDSSENSYDACLEAISNCDYYILLIGSRVGGLYSIEPKISITQKEYQIASELFDKGIIKKIFTFVRKDIWTIKEDRKALGTYLKQCHINENEISETDIDKIKNHESTFIKDADFIFNFINEVCKISQMKSAVKGDIELPKNNWINQFTSFEDVIQVLKAELHLHSELSQKRWGEIILQELSQNLSHLTKKNANGAIAPICNYAKKFRKAFPKQMNEVFTVNKSTAAGAYWFVFLSRIYLVNLSVEMLKGALQSGVFLNYDSNKMDYSSGNLQKALYELSENISRAKKIIKTVNDSSLYIKRFEKLIKNTTHTEISLNSGDIVTLIALHDCQYNIIEISRYLFAVIKFNYNVNEYPTLYSTRIFEMPTTDDFVFGEDVSPEEIYNHFGNPQINNKE